jgi:hypothetical protein
MSKVAIMTPDGKYVGGGLDPEFTDRLSRAYLYEDNSDTDDQISIVNAMYNCGWRKVDIEEEVLHKNADTP